MKHIIHLEHLCEKLETIHPSDVDSYVSTGRSNFKKLLESELYSFVDFLPSIVDIYSENERDILATLENEYWLLDKGILLSYINEQLTEKNITLNISYYYKLSLKVDSAIEAEIEDYENHENYLIGEKILIGLLKLIKVYLVNENISESDDIKDIISELEGEIQQTNLIQSILTNPSIQSIMNNVMEKVKTGEIDTDSLSHLITPSEDDNKVNLKGDYLKNLLPDGLLDDLINEDFINDIKEIGKDFDKN